MFNNRLDLFQEKSGRFHFKNNWKSNLMKKNGIFILITELYFVEEQTGSFDSIPRSGLIKQLTSAKCSLLSPLTDNPTVKGYVNPEKCNMNLDVPSLISLTQLGLRTELGLRQANYIDPSAFSIILAKQFKTSATS